jgi:hypothetical protein
VANTPYWGLVPSSRERPLWAETQQADTIAQDPALIQWCRSHCGGLSPDGVLRLRCPMDLLAHQNKLEQVHGDTNYPVEGLQD